MLGSIGDLLLRYGWDTRCRNLVPANALRPMIGDATGTRPMLLDVGCGALGLAAFLPDVRVVGVDIDQEIRSAANFTFQAGNITALPFDDRSFPFVSCVDVIEHLPLEIRATAIAELVRVADRGIVIACPHGERAERCDHDFRDRLLRQRKEVPSWLDEHLRQPYPTVAGLTDEVRSAAAARGREVDIEVRYCEPQRLSRVVRAAAARSFVLYSALNLALGAAFPLLPEPAEGESYRAILLVRFKGGQRAASVS